MKNLCKKLFFLSIIIIALAYLFCDRIIDSELGVGKAFDTVDSKSVEALLLLPASMEIECAEVTDFQAKELFLSVKIRHEDSREFERSNDLSKIFASQVKKINPKQWFSSREKIAPIMMIDDINLENWIPDLVCDVCYFESTFDNVYRMKTEENVYYLFLIDDTLMGKANRVLLKTEKNPQE